MCVDPRHVTHRHCYGCASLPSICLASFESQPSCLVAMVSPIRNLRFLPGSLCAKLSSSLPRIVDDKCLPTSRQYTSLYVTDFRYFERMILFTRLWFNVERVTPPIHRALVLDSLRSDPACDVLVQPGTMYYDVCAFVSRQLPFGMAFRIVAFVV